MAVSLCGPSQSRSYVSFLFLFSFEIFPYLISPEFRRFVDSCVRLGGDKGKRAGKKEPTRHNGPCRSTSSSRDYHLLHREKGERGCGRLIFYFRTSLTFLLPDSDPALWEREENVLLFFCSPHRSTGPAVSSLSLVDGSDRAVNKRQSQNMYIRPRLRVSDTFPPFFLFLLGLVTYLPRHST